MKFNIKTPILKAGLDIFALKALAYTGIGTGIIVGGIVVSIAGGMFVMYNYALASYDIHLMVIKNGTQMLLNGVLGHEIAVRREVFETILELIKQYKLNPAEEIQALTAILNNIIEYKDANALHDIEGQKIKQVVTELQKLIEERVAAEKAVQRFLNNIPGLVKRGWIE